ncbi:hypothetical protein [Methylibium sp.]|uniref:hypothetical protein n=1 Tax=Methylibium sp. TaxID=2067992 RepID=UPI003D0BFDDE
MTKLLRTPVFFGLAEPVVDQVLEHLSDFSGPPDRCFVYGSDMQLLGALVEQWKTRVEIVVVLVPQLGIDTLDAAILILEHEGLEPSAAAWVCGTAEAAELSREWRAVVSTGDTDAKAIAEALAQELSR